MNLTPQAHPELDALMPTKPEILNIPDERARFEKSYIKKFIVGLLFAAAAIYLFITEEIATDYRINQDAVYINGPIKGRCTSRMAVFVTCNTSFYYNGEVHTKDFSFFDLTFDDYNAKIVASQSNPELASIDLALDKLYSRTAVLLFFLLMSGSFFGSIFLKHARNKKNAQHITRIAQEMSQQRNHLTLEVLPIDPEFDKKGIVTQMLVAEKQEKIHFNDITPLIMNYNDEAVILVITNPMTQQFLIVDNQLLRFNLTPEARNAFATSLDTLETEDLNTFRRRPPRANA